MVQGISGTTHAWPTRIQWHTKTDCVVPHLLQTEAEFKDFKQVYMPNAPDQILSLSQLVEAGYVLHFRPSAQKSWLTTPCKKQITVVLVDSVWRMPLWQDSAHPRVLRSDTAIARAIQPQRMIGAADKRVSWHTACLPLSEARASNSPAGEPLPALGTTNKQVSWHIKSVPLLEAPNSGEPLPALFPNSGESLQSMQSEETVAIQQHLQTKDSDNLDVHVEEHIIQEHNDDQISSDGTVVWERNIRHIHHITALLTNCLADLPVKPNQALLAAQSAYHTHLATQGSVFRPAHHLRFRTEHATQAPPSQLERGCQKRRWRRFTRTYAHTDIIKHQLKVYSEHVCPFVLEAPCSHPESCTRCAYVGKKCDIASTPLLWQCLPCESAEPCFMAAGSTQNTYTTRPVSPEDETMMQALHDKWGRPSNSKFVQIYRAQNRVGFPTSFLALLDRFCCKVCALCKGVRGYQRSTRVHYTDRTRHLRQCLPQATLSSAIPTMIQLLVS